MSRIDLRHQFPPPRDQGGLQACTALALADLIGRQLSRGPVPGLFHPSALYLYYHARQRNGMHNANVPVRPSDAFAALNEYGICPDEFWPFRPDQYRTPPPPAAAASAVRLDFGFRPLDRSLDGLRDHLAAGAPFFFCLRLCASNSWAFEAGRLDPSGCVPMPLEAERPLRNHALLAAGFDDRTRTFLVRNSRGPGWGRAGYAMIRYEYLLREGLSYAFFSPDIP